MSWRKNSFTADSDWAEARWRKNSFSGPNECVELAVSASMIGVRDSKSSTGAQRRVSTEAWTTFLGSL
jgi:hypothetical protein